MAWCDLADPTNPKGAQLHVLKAITFRYDGKEDRVLAAINPGRSEAWSCWLTRRLILALLERSAELLENTSALAKRVAADARDEVVAFERDAAIATTAQAMTNTPPELLKTSAASAELIKQLKMTQQQDNFRIELHGEEGGAATGMVSRAEFQRILQMLRSEVATANWQSAPVQPPAAAAPESLGAKPSRH